MLRLQVTIEGATERFLARLTLAWDRERSACSGCRLMFDEVFEVVIIEVICHVLAFAWTPEVFAR